MSNEVAHATLTIQMAGSVVAFGLNVLVFQQLGLNLWRNVDHLFPSLYPSPEVERRALEK